MSQQNAGSITAALQQGAAENHGFIVDRSNENFRPLWLSIANAAIPPNRRRAAGPEDAVQETLRELDRELQKPGCTFNTREDIRRWGCRATSCNAIDLFKKNIQMEGPSVVAKPRSDGSKPEANDALTEAVDIASTASPPPEVLVMERDIERDFNELSQMVQADLAALLPPDQAIVSDWLDFLSYREIKDKHHLHSLHYVRTTTFDFKIRPELEKKTRTIREDLIEAETRWPGIADRICLQGAAARLLIDFRESL